MFPRRCIGLSLLLSILIVALPRLSFAATLLVPEDFSLDEALASAAPGDTVSVAGGAIDEGVVTLPPGIVLLSRESQGNTLIQLLAWNLERPSTVRGFHFTLPYRWDRFTPTWLGVIVDHSEVSFVDCQFIGLESQAGMLTVQSTPELETTIVLLSRSSMVPR